MVIFVKPNGATVVENDVIGLGSFVGKIAVVSPTRTGAYVTLHVAPANGEYLEPMYCAPMISTDVDDLGIYLCDMTRSISAVAGRVRYQVSFVYEDGREEFTTEGSFTVSQGVVSIPPDDPSESMYNVIRSALIANINNYTEIVKKLDMVWEAKTLVEENLEKINESKEAAEKAANHAQNISENFDVVASDVLKEAKESGMFDGVSVTHEWDGSVLRVTSASGTSGSDLRGPEGKQGETGKGFEISKTYESVSAMNAGFATDDVPLYGFVLIDTGNVEDEDNAKLYVKQESGYQYLTDLSGSQGIKGERGYSAFELAVQQGFVGGVAEWLASLKKPAEDAAKNVVKIANDAAEEAVAQAKESGEFDGKSAYNYAKDDGYTGTEAEYAEDINPDNIKAEVTPELGVDYFTENDQANIVARVYDLIKNGGVVGFVDENNNIVLTGNIADGEYTLKYENVDGTYTDIGMLEVGAIPEPEPNKTNFFVIGGDGYLNPGRASSSGADRTDVTDCFLTNYIEVQNGDEIYAYNAHSSNANVGNMGLYKADKSGVGFYVRTTASDPYLDNVSLSDEVDIFTITYEGATYMRVCCLIPTDLSIIKINIKRNGEWL